MTEREKRTISVKLELGGVKDPGHANSDALKKEVLAIVRKHIGSMKPETQKPGHGGTIGFQEQIEERI